MLCDLQEATFYVDLRNVKKTFLKPKIQALATTSSINMVFDPQKNTFYSHQKNIRKMF